MIRETAKRLGADNISSTALNKFKHLSGQEPAFTCLITDGYVMFCHGCQIIDFGRGQEVDAPFQFFPGGPAEIFEQRNAHIAKICGRALSAQVICFKVAVVETVEQEVQQIRHYGLCALCLQQFHYMVIGKGENFTRISPTIPTFGFVTFFRGEFIEIFDNAPDVSVKFKHRRCAPRQ